MQQADGVSQVTGVLLAGGQSRRMGGVDKTFATLGGLPLINHALTRLKRQVSGAIISSNADPNLFADFDLPVIADPIAGYAGPLAGLLAGMLWARDHSPESHWIFSAATDTPFFPDDAVGYLMSGALEADGSIAFASSRGRLHPVFGLWSVALAEDLEAWLAGGQPRKVLAFADRHTYSDVPFADLRGTDAPMDPFFNVNTPADLASAETMLRKLTP